MLIDECERLLWVDLRHSPRLTGAGIEAKRVDPGYKLTISAPTNADAREIDAAIVADRRRSRELGEDTGSYDRSHR